VAKPASDSRYQDYKDTFIEILLGLDITVLVGRVRWERFIMKPRKKMRFQQKPLRNDLRHLIRPAPGVTGFQSGPWRFLKNTNYEITVTILDCTPSGDTVIL